MEKVSFWTPIYLSSDTVKQSTLFQKFCHHTSEPFFHVWQGRHVTVDKNGNVTKNEYQDSWRNCAKRICIVVTITLLSLGTIPLIMLTVKIGFRHKYKFTKVDNQSNTNVPKNEKNIPKGKTKAPFKSSHPNSKQKTSESNTEKSNSSSTSQTNSVPPPPLSGSNDKPPPIFLRMLGGYTLEIPINMTDTLKEFLQNVVIAVRDRRKEIFFPNNFKVVFCGKALEDEIPLWQYHFEKEGSPYLLLIEPFNAKNRALLDNELINRIQEVLALSENIVGRVARGCSHNNFKELTDCIKNLIDIYEKVLPKFDNLKQLDKLIQHLRNLTDSLKELRIKVDGANQLFNKFQDYLNLLPKVLVKTIIEYSEVPDQKPIPPILHYQYQPYYLLRNNLDYFFNDNIISSAKKANVAHLEEIEEEEEEDLSGQKLEIYIRVLGETITINNIIDTQTIRSMVLKLVKENPVIDGQKVKPEDIKLIFAGQHLDFSKTLKAYNLQRESVVYGVLRKNRFS